MFETQLDEFSLLVQKEAYYGFTENSQNLQNFGEIFLDFHEISPEFHQNFKEFAAPIAKSRNIQTVST